MSRAGQYEVRGVSLLPETWERLNVVAARRVLKNPFSRMSAAALIREAVEAFLSNELKESK